MTKLTFKDVFEDANPVPVNNVQGGQVAALGVGPQGTNNILLNKKKKIFKRSDKK